MNDLESNQPNLAFSILKPIIDRLPITNPFLKQLICDIVPNNRNARIEKYTLVFEEKISKIPIEQLNNLSDNNDFIDLLEEGFVQATRALTDERRQYIASIVTNGIIDEVIELSESKYLLKIIQELNDIEIIWLCYYGNDYDKRQEFYEKHKNVLEEKVVILGDGIEVRNKAAIQKSYIDHLARLKLVVHKFRTDKATGLPKYKSSGEPEISGTTITVLGHLLLKQMGLIDGVK